MKKRLLPCFRYFMLCCVLSGTIQGNLHAANVFQDTIGTDTSRASDRLHVYQLPSKVNVLYGVQAKEKLVQSIGYLDGKRLESVPAALLSNAFAGNLAGLNSSQSNGAPRYDNPSLSLRGANPLVVIDGVPRYSTVYDELSLILNR